MKQKTVVLFASCFMILLSLFGCTQNAPSKENVLSPENAKKQTIQEFKIGKMSAIVSGFDQEKTDALRNKCSQLLKQDIKENRYSLTIPANNDPISYPNMSEVCEYMLFVGGKLHVESIPFQKVFQENESWQMLHFNHALLFRKCVVNKPFFLDRGHCATLDNNTVFDEPYFSSILMLPNGEKDEIFTNEKACNIQDNNQSNPAINYKSPKVAKYNTKTGWCYLAPYQLQDSIKFKDINGYRISLDHTMDE